MSAFSSKFDAYLKGTYTLTSDEAAGMQLFNGKGNCNSCHVNGRGTVSPTFRPDHSKAASTAPKFTCFGSANEGLPLNPRDAILYQNTADSLGSIANPDGFGLQGFGYGKFPQRRCRAESELELDTVCDGQFQVSSARNVAMTPAQCPTTEAGSTPYFQKGFFTMAI